MPGRACCSVLTVGGYLDCGDVIWACHLSLMNQDSVDLKEIEGEMGDGVWIGGMDSIYCQNMSMRNGPALEEAWASSIF